MTNLFLDGLKAGRRAGRDGVTQMEDWENMPNPAESAGGPGTPRTEIEQARTQEQIERALAGLPPLYRMAVILRDLEGLSYAEIAELQETTVETVRTRLRRARARLREVLRGEIPGIE